MNQINKNKKRILGLAVLIIATLITTVACTSGDGGGEDTPTTIPTQGGGGGGVIDPNETYDLRWWGLFDDPSVVEPLIEKYEELNPNVSITYIHKNEGIEDGTQIQRYRDELDTALLDEPLDSPDIITINNNWLGRYFQYLEPSTGVTPADVDTEFFTTVADDFIRNNQLFAVPVNMDSLVVIYNQDLMTRLSASDTSGPADTWFDFFAQANRLTQRDGEDITIAGFAGGLDNVEWLTGTVSSILIQSGVNMTAVDGLSGFANAATFGDDPQTQGLIDIYRDLYAQDENVWNQEFQNEVVDFLNEKVVMIIGPSWRLDQILNINNQYNLGLNVKIAKMPQIDIADPTTYSYWPTYWGYSVTQNSNVSQSGKSTVAWDFIQYLSEAEQLREYNQLVKENSPRQLDIIYPRKAMAEEQKVDEILAPFIESLEQARSWDMVDGFLVDQIFKDNFGQSGEPSATQIQQQVNEQVINNRTNLLTE